MSRPLRHFALWANLAVVALMAVLLAVTGCPQAPTRPGGMGPPRTRGVPVIRVLICSGPTLQVATTGAHQVLVDGRIVAASSDLLPQTPLTRTGRNWTLGRGNYPGAELTIKPLGNALVRVGPVRYRGKAVFTADGGGGMLDVNHLDVESYLAGVLSRELYPTWDDTTYRVQAIAARTYALYEKAAFGRNRAYDLRNDQSSQVYGGFDAETDRAWRAVRGTHGMVLATGQTGAETIFRTHYSSACGGVTNPVYVLYGPPVSSGPLVGGVACNDCQAATRYTWKPVSVPKDVIHKALGRVYHQAAALESVRTIKVVEEINGRPVWIDAIGPTGKKVRVRADDLRLALLRYRQAPTRGLYSMNCRIRDADDAIVFEWGRGFGHGVGLCQWGARGKALRGLTVEQILTTYYPTAKLFRAYN